MKTGQGPGKDSMKSSRNTLNQRRKRRRRKTLKLKRLLWYVFLYVQFYLSVEILEGKPDHAEHESKAFL